MQPTLVRGDMRYWLIEPDARLRRWVHCYFVVEPDPHRDALVDEPAELMLPDGHAEIVFKLGGDGYERWLVQDEDRRSVMLRSYLIGGRSHSVLTRNTGPVRLAGAKLDPRALHRLIAIPLTEFRDATLTLADLNHRGLLELEDSLANARSTMEMRRLLDAFFLRALGDVHTLHAATQRLLHELQRTRGQLSIMEWTRAHRLDARSLERRFSDAVGMTPKRYARIVRFKHSYHRLIAAGGRPSAGFHLDGFYDQSHFNREFRFFTGAAPSAKLADRMPSGTSISDHLLEGELGSPRSRSMRRSR